MISLYVKDTRPRKMPGHSHMIVKVKDSISESTISRWIRMPTRDKLSKVTEDIILLIITMTIISFFTIVIVRFFEG